MVKFAELGYYHERDKENAKKPFTILISLIFPFTASTVKAEDQDQQAPEEAKGRQSSKVAPQSTATKALTSKSKPYPPLINVHVIRVVDFISAIAVTMSIIICIYNMTVLDSIRESSGTLEYVVCRYFNSVIFVLLILDKISQVKRMPSWLGARALAFRLFGPEFLPVASSARRVQQLIMGVEMFIFTFPPFVDLLFGMNSMAGLIWLAAWKAFYAFWFFSMALVITCPVWSFTGLLMKWGLIEVPEGKLTALMLENITKEVYYCKVDGLKCKGLRYGRFGPFNETAK